MTEQLDPSGEPIPEGLDAAPASPGPSGPSGPLGSGTFSLEGRAAPGLYFAGWFFSLLAGGLLLVALLANGGTASVMLGFGGLLLLALGLLAATGAQALQRRGSGRSYDGPSPFLLFAASVPLTLLLQLVVAPALLGVAAADSPLVALVAVVITNVVYLLLVRSFVVGTGALSWAELGLGRGRPIVRDLLAGALLAIPVILLTAILADLLVRVVGVTPQPTLPPSRGIPGLLANLLTAALVAPLGEELLFRGVATTAWARGLGDRAGLIRGAIFFALVHVITITAGSFEEGLALASIAFLGRLPISIALGWIFLRRRSLYASIGLHAAFNGALVLLAEAAARFVAF